LINVIEPSTGAIRTNSQPIGFGSREKSVNQQPVKIYNQQVDRFSSPGTALQRIPSLDFGRTRANPVSHYSGSKENYKPLPSLPSTERPHTNRVYQQPVQASAGQYTPQIDRKYSPAPSPSYPSTVQRYPQS
jgi:hypothetical protein